MTEKNYSANFKMYNSSGLQAQFTVRADTAQEHINALTEYINLLSAMQWSANEPERGIHTTDTIIGYMWGQYNDQRSGKVGSCCHLYNQRGKFKAYTVYPERFDKLPQFIMATMPDDPEIGIATPPETEKAVKMKAFKPWSATINITPKLTADGDVFKNDKGFPVYYFESVVGSLPQPEPPAPKKEIQASAKGNVQNDNLFDEEIVQARKLFQALGGTLYGTKDWIAKRGEAVLVVGKQRTPPTDITSSNDLTLPELQKLILRLEKAARAKCYGLADEQDMTADDLERLVGQHETGATILEEVSGFALYGLLKALST